MKGLLKKLREKKQKRKERDEAVSRDFLQILVHMVKARILEMQQESNNIVYMPAPAEKPERETVQAQGCTGKKLARRWLVPAAVCVLCLVAALSFALCCFGSSGYSGGGLVGDGGNVDGGAKPYTAWHAKLLGLDEGVYFDDLYVEMLADEAMLVFAQIIPGLEAVKEIYDDETEEPLSYVLYRLVADASIGMDIVVFEIDYRVRFVPQYEFAGYETNYVSLEESFNIGEIEVKWQFGDIADCTWVNLSFAYGEYDYFLEIRTFEFAGFGIMTELNETNLIRLIQNLIPHG